MAAVAALKRPDPPSVSVAWLIGIATSSSEAGLISGVPGRLGRFHVTVAVRDSTRQAMRDSRSITLADRHAPTVTGVRPARGGRAGGGRVTITGTGFTTAHGVTMLRSAGCGHSQSAATHRRAARCMRYPTPAAPSRSRRPWMALHRVTRAATATSTRSDPPPPRQASRSTIPACPHASAVRSGRVRGAGQRRDPG